MKKLFIFVLAVMLLFVPVALIATPIDKSAMSITANSVPTISAVDQGIPVDPVLLQISEDLRAIRIGVVIGLLLVMYLAGLFSYYVYLHRKIAFIPGIVSDAIEPSPKKRNSGSKPKTRKKKTAQSVKAKTPGVASSGGPSEIGS